MSLPRIRIVPTASGATAVQIIWRYHHRRPVLDHIGSAHTDADLELLKAKARRMMLGDQLVLPISTETETLPGLAPGDVVSIPATSERASLLLDVIDHAYRQIGLDKATGGDTVFYDLVAARLIHPGSKFDTTRNPCRGRTHQRLVCHDPAAFTHLCHPGFS